MLAGQFLHGQLPSFLMGSSRGSKFEGEDTGTALKQSAPLTRCSAKADLGNLHGKEHDSSRASVGGQWTVREGRTKEVWSDPKLSTVFEVPC